MVEGIGDDARCHDADVAVEEVRIDGKGSDERDCGRFLRKILGHGVIFFFFIQRRREGMKLRFYIAVGTTWSDLAALAAPASNSVLVLYLPQLKVPYERTLECARRSRMVLVVMTIAIQNSSKKSVSSM